MVLKIPSPLSLSYWWNIGSLLGMVLTMQIVSGFLLSLSYVSGSFESVIQICQNSWYGWLIRMIHLNGASLFFMAIYLHMCKGLFHTSYVLKETWMVGCTILLVLMGTAFLGYVLPYGQMSLWGATVITNLVSAIPYIGSPIVYWVWGGYYVSGITISTFYSLHYILPFSILLLVGVHLYALHGTGSSSTIKIHTHESKISFDTFYLVKDGLNVVVFMLFAVFILMKPWDLGDSENWLEANPMVSPVHIKPEWYFLFAYGILRSIPSKLGGVVALGLSVVCFYLLIFGQRKVEGLNKLLVWSFIVVFIILTWLGGNPVEDPYIMLGQVFSVLYFLLVGMIIYL